jgi:hypothetical protein
MVINIGEIEISLSFISKEYDIITWKGVVNMDKKDLQEIVYELCFM